MSRNEQEIEKTLRPGDSFHVVFEEAASAGYLWTVETPDGLDISKKTVPNVKGGIGSFNDVSFLTTLEKPGNYEVTFTHKRPWEDEPIRTVRYVLSVKP